MTADDRPHMFPRMALDEVWRDYQADTLLDHFHPPATFVPGEGDANRPPVMFVGEAPGATEDTQGRPFVGQAGQLLDRLMGEVGLVRSAVWTTNLVKYRPPGNRPPTWNERSASLPYLRREAMIVRPRVLVTLGATALSVVLPGQSVTTAHGVLSFKGADWAIMPMFHPAYLLRQRAKMDEAQMDFAVLRQHLDSDSSGDGA